MALKRVAQGELNFALIIRQSTGNLRAVRPLVRMIAGNAELRVVEDVEEVGAELELVLLGDLEAFKRRKVEIDLVRPNQIPVSRVPKLMSRALARIQRGLHECCRVVPAGKRLVTSGTTVGDLLRNVKGEIVRVVNDVWHGGGASIRGIVDERGVMFAASNRRDSTHFPSADD